MPLSGTCGWVPGSLAYCRMGSFSRHGDLTGSIPFICRGKVIRHPRDKAGQNNILLLTPQKIRHHRRYRMIKLRLLGTISFEGQDSNNAKPAKLARFNQTSCFL